ncbi:hypothetical protein Asppvi_005976 [Aspergillus pseudoviridinutans]|uniref:Xylanolytic transcriptional activator regulatory domain-containing protein n=1 Tax=Aspergillus pseudoviridinutans TaxID=1517512 RepID=A0A9P3BFQ0_9EURO|nr:uncharacterized protein Asppvi_005976 [Aspergillus pseudoviridinutans]GIJ87074.1 hypothetical protein Asppvi_005976 [Aspergillus pseudoviridinutans]
MGPEDGSAPPLRKVRSACRRCRQKRVKNLATLCPEFDLSQGPKVNANFMESLNVPQDRLNTMNIASVPRRRISEPPSNDESLEDAAANKRSHSVMESDADSPLSAKARSVAIDLGMLSLQSDSRQKHYLGSSSGLLFAKLMGLDNDIRPEQGASQARRLTPQRISAEIYRSLYDQLRQDLPSPEEACLLLEVYFQNVHVDQPFLHPASLINAYHALYMCAQAGHNDSVDRNGWIDSVGPFSYNGRMDMVAGYISTPISIATAVFHVFMAFSLSATILTRKKNYDYSPTRFHRMAMLTASETFSNISVTSLQAILLLALQSLTEPAAVNLWTLTHIAMSHCIDLGLHREPSVSDLPAGARALLRFIFYTVYSLDRSVATIQGRPLGIRDETFDIRPPDESDVTEVMSLAGSDLIIKLPMHQVLALSISRFRLDQHISQIKLLLYHLPTRNQSFVWPTNLSEIQTRIKSELDHWLLSVQRIVPADDVTDDEKLDFQIQKMRHEQLYHSAISLLFQPSQMFPSPSQEALRLCYQSCSKRLQIYDAVSNQDMLYYNWRNIHGIFSSGATIVYCAWASRDLQRTLPFAKLLRDLRTCSNHLSIGSQWWPSVRSGKESFEMMIDLIIKYFSDIQLQIQDLPPPPQKQQRPTSSRTESSLLPPSYSSVSGIEEYPSGPETSRGNQEQMRPGQSVFNDQTQLFATLNEAQPSFGNMDISTSANSLQEFDMPTIEAAMESFMAEYLHEDWGWDPFSSSTGVFDNQGSGPV